MTTMTKRKPFTKTPKDKIVTLGFQAEPELAERVDREAERNSVSRSDVLRWAVLAWLQQKEMERGMGIR